MPLAFETLKTRVESRKGGPDALDALLMQVMPVDDFARTGDDRVLAMMSKCINNAGFNWSVIEKKWPGFEEAFHGFDLARLASLAPEDWEAYAKDTRIVRNWPKIKAVMENVGFVLSVSADHGSFARFLADWPVSDQVGLMAYLKKHGSRLGGNTGQFFLRFLGKDGFVLSGDVIMALRDSGVDIPQQPTAKRDLARVQDCFNRWHDETGLPYTHLSQIAAYSIGRNYSDSTIEGEIDKYQAEAPE